MHNLPSPFKTACEDKHLAGFKKYTKSACLLKCRADYVISMCKCRSYDLEGKTFICVTQICTPWNQSPQGLRWMRKINICLIKYHSVHLPSTTKYKAPNLFFPLQCLVKKKSFTVTRKAKNNFKFMSESNYFAHTARIARIAHPARAFSMLTRFFYVFV